MNTQELESEREQELVEQTNEISESCEPVLSSGVIVEYGSATKLTKGRGGRHSEQGYTMP